MEVENVIETPTDVVEATEDTNVVDEMNDDELDSFLDGDTVDTDDVDTVAAKEPEQSLDDLYLAQNQSKETKLDKPMYIKINGTTHTIDNVDEMRNLMERGLNHTQKMQELARDRKEFESNRVDEESPTVTEDATTVEVDEIANDILNSSYAESFQSGVSQLPSSVRSELSTNPQMLKGLSQDYESGLAQKIVPSVAREMAVKGISFRDAYVSIGQKLNQQTQQVAQSRDTLNAQPKANTSIATNTDVNSMSDGEFDKYFAKM